MNPVLRESLEIFFAEGQGFAIYFYLLIILALVEFLSLYLPSLDAQMWSGSGNLFKVCSVAGLLLIVYFGLRVGNQEYAPWRFKPLRYWLRDSGQPPTVVAQGQLAFLGAHLLCSLLLSAPFLVWAAAIARTPLSGLAATLALLAFYGFCYSVWGLVTLALWERRPETRQVLIRCFFFFLVLATVLIYMPLNPAAYLLGVIGRQDLPPLAVAGMKWPANTIHFGFHLLLGTTGVAAHHWALRRGLEH